MKALVVYDTLYGNTEKIARAIGGAIAGDVRVVRASEPDSADTKGVELFIVGSPTQGGRPTRAVQEFLDKIPDPDIRGARFAAFDTRSPSRLVRLFGYAAERISASLAEKGGVLVLPPEGFFVEGSKGPLREGELERAAGWAKRIAG